MKSVQLLTLIVLISLLPTSTTQTVCDKNGNIGSKKFDFFSFQHQEHRKSSCYFILDQDIMNMVNQQSSADANYFRISAARKECLQYNATLPIVMWKENAEFLGDVSKRQPYALGWKNTAPDDNMRWTTGRLEESFDADYEPAYWIRKIDKNITLDHHFTYAQYDSVVAGWAWIDALTDENVPRLLVICEQQAVSLEVAFRVQTPQYDDDNGAVRIGMWYGNMIGMVGVIFVLMVID